MLKGIEQEKRNNAWHKKHTKKKAQQKISHFTRVLLRNNGEKQKTEAERKFKEAQMRELLTHIGLWSRIKLYYRRLKNFFKNKLSFA